MNNIKTMFYHGYHSCPFQQIYRYHNYLLFGFPSSEVRPITCQRGSFDLSPIPYLTLIDTLDTFLVLGDYEGFRRNVELLEYVLFPFFSFIEDSRASISIRTFHSLKQQFVFSVACSLLIWWLSRDNSLSIPNNTTLYSMNMNTSPLVMPTILTSPSTLMSTTISMNRQRRTSIIKSIRRKWRRNAIRSHCITMCTTPIFLFLWTILHMCIVITS